MTSVIRTNWHRLVPVLSVVFLFAAAAICMGDHGQVVFVVDGDTVKTKNGKSIRLAGINTPEIAYRDRPGEPYGEAAKQQLKAMVAGERMVWRRLGVDRHGRWVAVVHFQDGRNLNLEMVAAGWAYRLPTPETKAMGPEFTAAQKRAMAARLGIWKGLRRHLTGPFWGNRKSGRFHAPHCRVGAQLRRGRKVRFKTITAAFEAGFAPGRDCLSGNDLFDSPLK